jgi:two-component system response regulator HydG
MALTLQAKVLRALQEGEIRRVGGERNIRVRPRIVAATNRNLRAAVAEGRFREDLYFRLGAFVIAIPALRDRPEDIPALAHEFLRQAAGRLKKDVQSISSEAMTALVAYAWPGNVRELEHAIERAVILARSRVIGVRDLPPEAREQPDPEAFPGPLALKGNEPALIREALRRFHGNRKRAAAALNVSPVTLWRKMKRLGISDADRD